jgi:hypothetical protein
MSHPFRDIEQSYEAKYKLDEELRFKAECRRTKLLGLWAAEQMGITGSTAVSYSRSLLRNSLETPGFDHLIGIIAQDFQGLGVKRSERDIVMMAERFEAAAIEQISNDFPTALGADHVQVGG